MNLYLSTKRTKVTKEVTTLAWPPSFVVFVRFVVMLPAVHGLHT